MRTCTLVFSCYFHEHRHATLTQVCHLKSPNHLHRCPHHEVVLLISVGRRSCHRASKFCAIIMVFFRFFDCSSFFLRKYALLPEVFSLCCHPLTFSPRTSTGAVSLERSPNTRIRPQCLFHVCNHDPTRKTTEISALNSSLLGILVLVD